MMTSVEDLVKTYGWVYSPTFQTLWREFWKSSKTNTSGGSILKVPASHEFTAPCLNSTNGQIFVREEYVRLLKRLEKACTDKKPLGVVITGSPGIGKSYFNLYLLIVRLCRGETTVYTASDRHTYIFCSQGVLSKYSDFVGGELTTFAYTQPRIWSLIGADSRRLPPADRLVNSTVFPVQTVSPDTNQYKDWVRRNYGSIWFMDPWNPDELSQGLELHADWRTFRGKNHTVLTELLSTTGPCIRDVFDYINGTFLENVRAAVSAIGTSEMLMNYISTMSKPLAPSTVPHTLFTLSKGVPNEDSCIIDFKSPYVAQQVMTCCTTLLARDAHRFFEMTRCGPEASMLAGWVFQKLGVLYLSGSLPASQLSVLGTFAQMLPDEHDSLGYSYWPSNSTAQTLTVRPTTTQVTVGEQEQTIPREFGNPVQTPSSLPITRRTVQYYDETNEIGPLNTNSFYVPIKLDQPLFDAFFVEDTGPSGTPLWIIQFTTSKRHRGLLRSYEDVTQICSKLQDPVVRYVLVAPQEDQRAVNWILPKSGSKDDERINGQVFIQYLNLEAFISRPAHTL